MSVKVAVLLRGWCVGGKSVECCATLAVTNSSDYKKTNVRTSVGAVSTLNMCTTSTVATVAMRGAGKICNVRGIRPRVIGKRVRTIVRSVRPSTVGVNVMGSYSAVQTVTRALGGCRRDFRRLIVSPIVMSADNYQLVRRSTLSMFVARLLPLTALLAPGVPRTRVLTGEGVRGMRSVGTTTTTVDGLKYECMLVGNNRFSKRRGVSCLFRNKGRGADCHNVDMGAHGARNANYALSSTVASCLTERVSVGATVTVTGACLSNTVLTNGSVGVKRNRNPIGRFCRPGSLFAGD